MGMDGLPWSWSELGLENFKNLKQKGHMEKTSQIKEQCYANV